MRTARLMLVMLAIVGLVAVSADAMTVAGYQKGGFADFSKAIVFDTSTYGCPVNAETIQGSSNTPRSCALPMRAVGDGSWVCTATVIAGANYAYWFEYRIPIFDSTSVYTDSQKTYVWRNSSVGGGRAQDQTQQRTIAVPANVTAGYVFYNYFGDPDVTGKQGTPVSGDSWLSTANPDLASYLGTADVSSSGNNDTTDMGGSNNYGVSVTQLADTSVRISWQFKITAGDDIAPTVEGAKEFDTQSTYNPYGYRILRARLASGWSADTTTPSNLKFEDTVVNKVTGDTLFSPSRPGGAYYNAVTTFTDTTLPANTATGDSFVYTVLWVDAYGNKNDTGKQNFSGGAARWVRGGQKDVLFLVENFDPNVVFPDGATEGRIRITPWVDGIPQPAYSFWSPAYLATRKSL